MLANELLLWRSQASRSLSEENHMKSGRSARSAVASVQVRRARCVRTRFSRRFAPRDCLCARIPEAANARRDYSDLRNIRKVIINLPPFRNPNRTKKSRDDAKG